MHSFRDLQARHAANPVCGRAANEDARQSRVLEETRQNASDPARERPVLSS
jgi:hypothetical protein